MSELTDWIDKTCDECDRECRVAGSTEDLQKDPFKAQAHTIAGRIRWHLRAHNAEIREQALTEQFDQLYAAAGVEVMDAYRASHEDDPLTVQDVVRAVREATMREQYEADCRAVCEKCRYAAMYGALNGSGAYWRHGFEHCEASAIRAAYAKALEEKR